MVIIISGVLEDVSLGWVRLGRLCLMWVGDVN